MSNREKRGFKVSEAAYYIGRSVSYLKRARLNPEHPHWVHGPACHRAGRNYLYLREDLDRWLNSFIEASGDR